jgi:2'-5' RNA ligase
MAAHVTILPPRALIGSETTAVQFLEEACSPLSPFDIDLADVETFLPTTPTVFIQIARAAYRLRELHDRLAAACLCSNEEFLYIPHLTIVKMETEQQTRAAYAVAKERWAQYRGPRRVRLEEVTFVREDIASWQDVAPIPLGRSLLSHP